MGHDERQTGKRSMIYCLVPRDLAARLHEPLRRHFAEDPRVEVIVERRAGERRRVADRRARPGRRADGAQRRILSPEGRRAGERRGALVEAERPSLPRRAGRYADRLVFVERLEPSTEHAEDLDSARLVTRFQAGDRDAFAGLYIRYFDRVYNYLRLVLRDPHAAEDAAQQVFLQVLEALPRYEHRREPFRGWLFVAVRNYAVSQLRKEHRLDLVEPAELDWRRESAAPEEERLRALDWISDGDLLLFIERLPLVQRQVLLMRYMLDLTHAEIAQVLNRSPDDVRMLQHRAQRFLKDRLSAVGRRAERGKPERMVGRAAHAYLVRRRRFALLR